MRLHRLTLSAFLAFPQREEIDFDALSDAGLFLLHGRTGAGKTALLDAVCFAFYGAVPGARAGSRLRSDHAGPDVRTEVELEATLRGRRVRITRIPEHERPKLRGDGTTREPHRVRVVELLADGSELVLATRHEEARLELDDLLGMTREQFCQVVLLPQGGFARFLHAGSDQREALLRELFDVQRFANVERWLRDARFQAQRTAAEAIEEVRITLARTAQAAGVEMPAEWEAGDVDLAGWLEEQLVVAEASATTAQEADTAAAATGETAVGALAAGRELAAHQEEHVRAAAELAGWEARRGERDARAAELTAARRAAPVHAHVQGLRSAGVAAERAAARAAAARGKVAGAPQADADALRALGARLRGDAGAVAALGEREAAVEAEEGALRRLRAEAAERGAEAERLAEAIAAAEAELPAIEAAAAAARDATARLAGLREAAAVAAARAAAGAERDRVREEAESAHVRRLGARELAADAREEHQRLLARRLDGIAAELAGHLVDGTPCAVCGAVAHPHPAAPPRDGIVSEDEVQAAAEQAEALVARRDEAAHALAMLETDMAAAVALAGEEPVPALRAAATGAQAELAAAEAASRGAVAADATLAARGAELEAMRGARGTAEVAGVAAATALRQRSAALERDRRTVDEARAGAPTIEARVRRLEADADAAEAAAGALDDAARTAREAATARTRAAAAAVEAGFPDLAALERAVRDAGGSTALEAAVRAWDDGVAERRAAASRPELVAAAAAASPDVDTLRAAAEVARATAERTRADVVLARRRHTELRALRDDLAGALAAAAPARRRLALVREVATLADGSSASNRLRMRLSAYVLAARLEEVAAAATMRLARMSGGRYALEHADDEGHGRTRGGLDLRVVDAWTGRDRAPASLSGGETFLASLALALGLADVVTAEAGGARLETLFVDEGFGSLDDEGTLDEVLAVLDGLRDGGRAVGIVSHVAELRQRIPTQLRVERGRGGSHVVAAEAVPA